MSDSTHFDEVCLNCGATDTGPDADEWCPKVKPLDQQLAALIAGYDEPETETEFNPADRFGGNFDDAYNGGFADGERALAAAVRRILEKTGCLPK
jgi:hypothetical protein